ncbi:MAG TPA: response regulator [Ktedonobacterales bacterium]
MNGWNTQAPAILIVEDDDGIRETLRALLDDAGYRVVDALADGQRALQRLRASSERLVVLLDLLLPGVGGQQVVEAIVADPALATRHALVIATAQSRTMPRSLVTALAQLQAPILQKPFDIDTALKLVAEAARRIRDE